MKHPEVIDAFGLKIRKLREKKGCSQYDLAYDAGINKKTLQKIELGKTATNLGIIASLAKALGVEIRDLF